uniref:Uncharacterized protein n=1 Tax=Amphimedon queenslandica TaxID=400682 RepID=A0A1X7SS65_AMPQE
MPTLPRLSWTSAAAKFLEELKSLLEFECGLEVDSLEPIEKQSWRFFAIFLICVKTTVVSVLIVQSQMFWFFYWYRQCTASRI